MASNKDSRTLARRERFKAFRKETDWTQSHLGELMRAAAAELRMDGATAYDAVTVSKTEIGTRDVSFDDVAILARIDPQQRGELWFGWGREERLLTEEELDRAAKAAEAARRARTPAEKARGARRA